MVPSCVFYDIKYSERAWQAIDVVSRRNASTRVLVRFLRTSAVGDTARQRESKQEAMAGFNRSV